jgi:hypothetical protein
MIARCDQDVRSSQREAIERRLGRRAKDAVIDAAGRLMEDGDNRSAVTPRREGRSCERSGDRVDKDGARPESLQPPKHCRATKSGKRERPLGKGLEDNSRAMRRRCIRHPEVIQIPAAQAAWIA